MFTKRTPSSRVFIYHKDDDKKATRVCSLSMDLQSIKINFPDNISKDIKLSALSTINKILKAHIAQKQ